MQCICMVRKGKLKAGLNLANQVCHWKDEMILVEIDIKITETDAWFANGEHHKNGAKL